PLGRFQPARLAEPFRKDQPARAKVLDRDLARVVLVDAGEVIEHDPPVELHLEQFVDGQLAARVGEADDNAIDRPRTNDRRDIFDGTDNTRIDDRRPDAARIGIDEADDLYCQLAPTLETLPGKGNAGRAGS